MKKAKSRRIPKKSAKKKRPRISISNIPLPADIEELVLAYEALDNAANAVLAIKNQPRAEGYYDGYLEGLWEGLLGRADDAARKLASMKPADVAERDIRLKALLHYHAESLDASKLVKLVADAAMNVGTQ